MIEPDDAGLPSGPLEPAGLPSGPLEPAGIPSGRPETDDVTTWALAAGRGDQSAATDFVRATQAEVWRLCAHLGDPASAADLTQETYLRAFSSLPRFAGRSSARTWLFSIARRVCADQIRTRRRRPRTDGELVEVGAPGDASGPAVVADLLRALSPQRREAFVLTQLMGLSYAETAAVCQCPIGTVRSRIARAREDLVAALHDPDAPL